MNDLVVFAWLVVAFAALVTAHVALVWGLAKREPRGRALAALVVFPLAPYWGVREHMRVRAALWMAFGVAYAVAWVFALKR